MYCSACGSYLPDDATRCPLCGTPLKPEAELDGMQQNVQQQETAYTEQAQYQQPQMPVQGQGMQYQQIPPVYHPQMQSTSEPPVGVGEWIGSMILRAIPVVGLIMMLVWSFSHSTNPSKRNWARAQLIIAIVSTLIGIVIGVIFVLANSFSGGYYY